MFQASKKQIQGGGFKYYFVKPLQKRPREVQFFRSMLSSSILVLEPPPSDGPKPSATPVIHNDIILI